MKSKLIVTFFVFMMNLSYATEATDRSYILRSAINSSGKVAEISILNKYAKENQADEPPVYYNPYGFDSERQVSFKNFYALMLITGALIAFSAYLEYGGQSSDAPREGGGESV